MRRRFARDAAGLSVGAALSGIAAYAYAAIGSRSLGAAAFAPVSVLWTAWAVTGAALAFPVQHWVIRRLHADGNDAGVRRALPGLGGALLAGSAVLTLAGWVAREDLFRTRETFFPLALGVIPLGAALMGLLRGRLAAEGRFAATSAAFAGENLIRVALAGVAAAAGWGPQAFAAILLAGFGIAVLWPGALRLGGGRGSPERQLGFLGGIAGASSLAQLVLTGAPVALALGGGRASDITSVFAALALFRAPYVIATGVAPRLTGTLTRSVVADDRGRMRSIQFATVAGTLGVAAVASAAAVSVAPPLLRALFGPEIALSRSALLAIAAGSGIALGTLVQGLVLISRARWPQMLGAWTAALAVGLAWFTAGPGDVAVRAGTAFLVAETVAFAIMLAMEQRALRAPIDPDAVAPPAATF